MEVTRSNQLVLEPGRLYRVEFYYRFENANGTMLDVQTYPAGVVKVLQGDSNGWQKASYDFFADPGKWPYWIDILFTAYPSGAEHDDDRVWVGSFVIKPV